MTPETVSLRPYRSEDVESFFLAARESFAEMERWMPWCHAGYSIDEARGWVEAQMHAAQMGSMHDYVIVAPDGSFAGACGINRIDGIDRVANLGYWVRSSRTGQGIAPIAVRKLSAWVFANTLLNRLEIVVALDNLRSQRVAEKAGAVREAVLRKRVMIDGKSEDAILYALVRDECA